MKDTYDNNVEFKIEFFHKGKIGTADYDDFDGQLVGIVMQLLGASGFYIIASKKSWYKTSYPPADREKY